MSRRLSISDQMELSKVLDGFDENIKAECVSYLIELYGFENEEEYNLHGLIDEDEASDCRFCDAVPYEEVPDCDLCDRPTDYLDAIKHSDDELLVNELESRGYEVNEKEE